MLKKQMLRSLALALVCLAMVAPMLLAQNVRANSSVVFTTTADFDNGTKAQPNVPRNWFLANGISQPENFINYPAAVYLNGRTYVAFQGDNDNDATTPDPFVTYYDHVAGTWATSVKVSNGNTTNDDHGAPSLLIDSAGYLHVFCCTHVGLIRHYKSVSPNSIASWVVQSDVGQGVGTYPHPVLLGSTVYLIFRHTSGATNTWVFVKSTNNAATWGSETTIFDGTASAVGYIGNTVVSGTKIFIPFGNAAGKNAYVSYLDTTTDHMFCKAAVSDVDLGTSISEAEADSNCRVENTGTGTDGANVAHVDGSGVPYTIYVANVASANFNFSYWTGSAWTAPVAIASAQTTSNQPDFIVNSATSIDAFLTRSGLNTGDRGGDIESWHWNGATWSYTSTLQYEKYAASTLNNPLVPWNFNSGLKVIFCETLVDVYFAGTSNFDHLKCFAHDGVNYVTNADALGTYSVETATNDPAILGGQLELASGKGDSFGFADADSTTFRWHTGRYLSGSDAPGRTRADVSTTSPGALLLAFYTGTGNDDAWGVISNFTLSGDFNVTIDPHQYPSFGLESSTRLWLNVLNEDTISLESSATVDGVAWREYWQAGSMRLWPYTITNGVGTVVGPGAGPTEQDYWLRISRVGSTITWDYSADGSAWITLATTTFVFSGSSRVTISMGANSGRNPQWVVNSFQFNTVTLNAGSYWTSGLWSSAAQTYGGKDVVTNVTVGYSGASAGGYIDAISVLDASGNILYTDGTDRTSGTVAVVNVPYASSLRQDWRIRVDLAGDGSTTVAVTDITVQLALPPTLCNSSIPGTNLLTLFAIILGAGLIYAIIVGLGIVGKPTGGDSVGAGGSEMGLHFWVPVILTILVIAVIVGAVLGTLNTVGC